MNRAFSQYLLYHDAIRKAFAPYETKLFQELPEMEGKFEELKKAGERDAAVGMLTQFIKDKCVEALSLVPVAQDNMTQESYNQNRWSR